MKEKNLKIKLKIDELRMIISTKNRQRKIVRNKQK